MANARLLETLLNSNGVISAGLAGTQESSVAELFRIPVFRNIPEVRTEEQMLHYLQHVYDHTLTALVNTVNHEPTRRAFALSHVLAYVYRAVAARADFANRQPLTAAAYNDLQMDGDTKFVDEDADLQNNTGTVTTALADKEQVQKIITLVVAAKVTWFTTNHHLGVPLAARQGGYQGFLFKVANTLNFQSFSYNTAASRGDLYKLIHPWSTISVMRQLDPTRADQIKEVFPLGVGHLTIIKSQDVVLRIGSFPAGTAKYADIYAGLKSLVVHPLFVLCPGVASINAFLDAHTAVKNNPYNYGQAANYIGANPVRSVEDFSPFDTLFSAVHVFVSSVLSSGTLVKAAVFSSNPVNDPGFDAGWSQACAAYVRTAQQGVQNAEQIAIALVGATGGIIGQPLNPQLAQRLVDLGYNDARFNTARQAVVDEIQRQQAAAAAQAPANP